MRARVLRDFFTGAAGAEELASETADAIHREEMRQTHYLEDLDEPFEVSAEHLIRVCDAVMAGSLPPDALEAIGYALASSEQFTWDGTTEEGAIIALTVTQWAAPETAYSPTPENVSRYRRRLTTGERAFARDDAAADRNVTRRVERVTASRSPRHAGGVVAIAGGTGLVGRETLAALGASGAVTAIVSLARRPVPEAIRTSVPNGVLAEQTIDFERLEELDAGVLGGAATVICALGTTIRTAGTRERFFRVDHDYPVALARLARRAGARHFLLVSAMGADPFSRVFYNRVKGEAERDVAAVGLERVTILRPSLLLGAREEFRPMERLAGLIGRLIPGRYRPIHSRDVAHALTRLALGQAEDAGRSATGIRIVESAEIRRIAAR